MTKRHAWWVIVMGDKATAFRARDREELAPTLKQLQHTQPDAVLKWFERGRLWTSPEEARAAAKESRRPEGPPRSRDWRPGGAHADPRAKYKLTRDQKRARWKQREGGRRERDEEGGRGGTFQGRGPRDAHGPQDRGRPPLDWKPPSAKRDEPSAGQRPPLDWKPPAQKRDEGSRPPVDWKPAPGPRDRRPAHGKPWPKSQHDRRPAHGSPRPHARNDRPDWKPAGGGPGWRPRGKPNGPPRLDWKPPSGKPRGESSSGGSAGWKPARPKPARRRPPPGAGSSGWKPARPKPHGERPLDWKPKGGKPGGRPSGKRPPGARPRDNDRRPFRPRGGGKGPKGR
jgi:23S rRNA pseudouridine2605 synthase